jgi:glycosyltransferase involved in cell wall biosynthesis
MNNIPLVSIILLSYNQSTYLEESINSAISQTYPEWELIIVDNGSSDDSHSIIKKYIGNNRIKTILHSTNKCTGLRLNEAITIASGEFVSFLYSDDYYLPEKLIIQVNEIQKLSSDWGLIYGPGYRLDMSTKNSEIEKCIEFSGEILKILFTDFSSGYINPISPLIRKECLINFPFYEDVFTEGEAIFFRIAMKYKFLYINEPLVVMRDSGNNARYAGKQNSEYFEIVLNKLDKHKDFPKELLFYYKKFKGITFRNNAWQNIRLGTDSHWVRSMLYKSVSSDWRQVTHPKTITAFILSLVPVFIRKLINLLANKIFNKTETKYFEKYYSEASN